MSENKANESNVTEPQEAPQGGEHHGEGHGSGTHHHHKHHKRRLKIPKNALIIAAAVVALLGLFVLMIRYFDRQDAEQPQLLPESTAGTEAALQPYATIAPAAQAAPVHSTVRWCALGDSIAYGMYSLPDGTSSATGRESIGWAWRVAEANGWALTNLAFSNEGYLNPAADGADTPGYKQARSTDFTPYDLVTISLGINDWLSGCPMGSMADDPAAENISAFIPAMRATLAAVAQSNLLCKILVLLPTNVKGFSTTYGTQETNWALGSENSVGVTLRQFTDAMKAVCEACGVEYIDLASASCVNSMNLPQLLPDGIHPSAEAHALLARELAAKIRFK